MDEIFIVRENHPDKFLIAAFSTEEKALSYIATNPHLFTIIRMDVDY